MYYLLLNRTISDDVDRNLNKKKCDVFHYEFGKQMVSLIIKNKNNGELNDKINDKINNKDRLNYYIDIKHFMKYYNENCSSN